MRTTSETTNVWNMQLFIIFVTTLHDSTANNSLGQELMIISSHNELLTKNDYYKQH